MSDNVTALKGTIKISSFNQFSGSGDLNRRFSKPQGLPHQLGHHIPKQELSFWTAGSSFKIKVPEANQATADRSDQEE